jgi:hypothetical protein
LTDVGEMSLRFQLELSGFLSFFTHRGLKEWRQVKVGAVSRTLFADMYCYVLFFSCFRVGGTHSWNSSKHFWFDTPCIVTAYNWNFK